MDKASQCASLEVAQPDFRLRVDFWSLNGFLLHTILVVESGKFVPVLKSLDPTSSQSFPRYTEKHRQGQTLFLTGADGPGHWSMSVTAREELTFDVAVRLKERLPFLGSAYEVLKPGISSLVVQPVFNCNKDFLDDSSIALVPATKLPTQFPTTVQWSYSIGLES